MSLNTRQGRGNACVQLTALLIMCDVQGQGRDLVVQITSALELLESTRRRFDEWQAAAFMGRVR
eukprot:1862592-Amphidinium_carterae.1